MILSRLCKQCSCPACQGSTGVLKTGSLPTWVINFGVGEAKILLDAVLRGQPTCHKIFVQASETFYWIPYAAAECIAASLPSRKDASRAMFTDPIH